MPCFDTDLSTRFRLTQMSIDRYTNFYNIYDLQQHYINEQNDLKNHLKSYNTNILTNERKTYYEEQGINNNNFYYNYILIIIYFTFVVSFIIYGFLYPSEISISMRLLILGGLVGLPFVSTMILSTGLSLMQVGVNILPKNTYLSV